jgi:zinc protease
MQSLLRINELAYGDYWPYAHSTIGDMQDLQKAPLKAVQEFFNDYYTPMNAVLSIAGDFEPKEALQLVERYFGDISGRDAPEYKPGELAPQGKEQAETLEDPLAELPAFHLAYHIPQDRHPDHYPLEMLQTILGDGESSRLYQELVKKREYLQEIDVDTDGRRGPDLFSVWAICAKGHSAEQARQLIYQQFEDIAENGVTKTELEKAKNRMRSMFVFGLQTNLARALHLAEFEMYHGNATLLQDEFERYRAVTVEDIKRVARQYFSQDNRTVLDVLPKKLSSDGRRQP